VAQLTSRPYKEQLLATIELIRVFKAGAVVVNNILTGCNTEFSNIIGPNNLRIFATAATARVAGNNDHGNVGTGKFSPSKKQIGRSGTIECLHFIHHFAVNSGIGCVAPPKSLRRFDRLP
jgi:hypothetical protein